MSKKNGPNVTSQNSKIKVTPTRNCKRSLRRWGVTPIRCRPPRPPPSFTSSSRRGNWSSTWSLKTSAESGVTFYSVLALFPAIAALVPVYGFFADPTTIASHLDWEAVACDDNGVASFNRVPYCHDQVKLTAASLPARLPRGL